MDVSRDRSPEEYARRAEGWWRRERERLLAERDRERRKVGQRAANEARAEQVRAYLVVNRTVAAPLYAHLTVDDLIDLSDALRRIRLDARTEYQLLDILYPDGEVRGVRPLSVEVRAIVLIAALFVFTLLCGFAFGGS